MWGPTGSGKTTFLGALNLALNTQESPWRLTGADDASTDALIDMTRRLTEGQAFPEATQKIDRYRWYLIRELEERYGLFGRKRRQRQLQVGLDLVDPSGGHYASPHEELVEYLVSSRGIVLLFDPEREYAYGDAFSSLHAMLSRVDKRMLEDGLLLPGGKLPHHVAVCVTKFDEYRVLKTAERLRLVTTDLTDRFGFPRVEGEDRRELFRELCAVRSPANAQFITSTLERYFRADQISYFVTSAVGFHVNERTELYDPDDFSNLDDPASGPTRIRGPVYPIQVLEPVLWLSERLTEG